MKNKGRIFILIILAVALIVLAGVVLALNRQSDGPGSPSSGQSSSPSLPGGGSSSQDTPSSSGSSDASGQESEGAGSSSGSTRPVIDKSDPFLRLVNNYNALPDDYDIETKGVQKHYVMEVTAADAMIQMIEAARQDGVALELISAYRTVARQTELHNEMIARYRNAGYSEEEAYKEATKRVAIPGKSEHNSGFAADIVYPNYYAEHADLEDSFDESDAFRWLDANAHKYGYILRYPKGKEDITEIIYEPWHYRYVGVEHAAAIKELGVCLEEYLA